MYSTATTLEIVDECFALTKGVEQSDRSWHFGEACKIAQVTEVPIISYYNRLLLGTTTRKKRQCYYVTVN